MWDSAPYSWATRASSARWRLVTQPLASFVQLDVVEMRVADERVTFVFDLHKCRCDRCGLLTETAVL